MTYSDYHDLYGESCAELMREEAAQHVANDRDMAADMAANGIACYIYRGELYAVPDSRYDDSTRMTGLTVAAFAAWLQEATR